jgi:exodeoxyribonuclease VII large subunit
MRHEGLGDILEKIERLRQQLASEGALDADRKKPLPFLPLCIGLITGKDSDAEKDVITNAKLRWSDVKFRVVHTLVQGDQCAPQVASAIETLDADPEVDVIIIARGGGEFLHLLPFSDERVVRAAVACETPLVSAIGHENDRPLLDEVADLRASTPTDAAKRVVPDVSAELEAISGQRSRAMLVLTNRIATEADRIAQLRNRPVMASPLAYLERAELDLANYVDKGTTLIDHAVDRATDAVHRLSAQLRTLSPQKTLDRGYAIVRGPKGTIASTIADVSRGDSISIQVADGDIAATVN